MTCDTGVNGSPEPGNWVASLPGKAWSDFERPTQGSGQARWDNPLEFALFGLARQTVFPVWEHVQWDKPVLDLGPGNKIIDGAIRCEYPEYNFESTDFNPQPVVTMMDEVTGRIRRQEDYRSKYRCFLPYEDNSVGGIYAVNILEHLWDPRPIMEECARVLAPGCPLNIVVPHGHAAIYTQDIDHKKPFVLDSWKNWLQNSYWGPDRSNLKLRVGVNFKFGIKEENVNIMTQLIKEA